jgi:cysteinyl-tRNA synthetase
MVFVRELVPEYGSDAVRLYLSGCHYRAELHHDPAELERAAILARALTAASLFPSGISSPDTDLAAYRDRFLERMSDDLDTQGAIELLRELAEEIHREAATGGSVRDAQELLRELGAVLGLRLVA